VLWPARAGRPNQPPEETSMSIRSVGVRATIPAALLALAALSVPTGAARGQSTVHSGALQDGDATLEGGEFVDDYTVEAKPGEEIVAVVSAVDFDPYLIVISPSGEENPNDDFGGSTDVALVEVPVEEGGVWRVRVSTYEVGERGTYALITGTRPDDGEGPGRVFRWEATEPISAGPRATVRGDLAEGDAVRPDGSFYDGFTLQAAPGETIVVTMKSPDFDAYLTVVSPAGDETSDDDSGGGTDSRVELTIDQPGEWIVAANSLSAGQAGKYELTVERSAPKYE